MAFVAVATEVRRDGEISRKGPVQNIQLFGKYSLLERVSVGGMAEVYRAKPLNAPNFRRFLAIKRILPNLAEDDDFITMFVDEAKIAVQLNHRNICQLYELGRLNGSYYIVMEFIGGRDLLAIQNNFRRNRKIMSVGQAAFVAQGICDGLDYAHRKQDDHGRPMNIVHRDISPQNVLVSYEGEVKVIDFGIARAATKSTKTQVGVLKGKFGYMSPEQVAGKEIDQRSDVFAVGVLLWEMLTARRLFHGESDFETLEKVRKAEVPPPSEKNPRVPPEIDQIVLKALARDRDERYAWASDFAADLRGFLRTIKPPYTQKTLGQWMETAFPDEFSFEAHKVDEYQHIVTAEDVRRASEDYLPPALTAEDLGELDLDGEATQVVDPARHGSPAEAGSNSVIFAENEDEPLPTVVSRSLLDDSRVGALKGSDTDRTSGPVADAAGPAMPVLQNRLKRRRNLAIGGLAVVLAAGAAAGGYWYTALRPGEVVISPTPSDGVTVLFDGNYLAPPYPVRSGEVPPGTYLVEIRHVDFQPVREEITVEAGASVQVSRNLVPLPVGMGEVSLKLSDPQAMVFVDGREVGGTGGERVLALEARKSHVIEVHRPGFFVDRREVTLKRDEKAAFDVQLEPVVGEIRVTSTPPGTVLLDGVERGSTQPMLTLGDLDPTKVYELEIRPRSTLHLPYRQTVVFDTNYRLDLRPVLKRIGQDADEPAVTYGWLATRTGDEAFHVLVDGRQTGFVTPIPESAKLPLKSGRRTVAFVRGFRRVETQVVIEPGKTVTLDVPK